MSRRTKREVAPPPCATANSSASSSGPPGVHILPAAPYLYGGPLFPTPLPSWFPFPLSQAMAGSSAYHPPPPPDAKMDVQVDLEQCQLMLRMATMEIPLGPRSAWAGQLKKT